MREELMIWFAQAVAHSLWVGLVIGALAWLLLRCFRQSPARQHAVLCGSLLLMALCLPVILAVFAPEFADLQTAAEPAHPESPGRGWQGTDRVRERCDSSGESVAARSARGSSSFFGRARRGRSP